MSAPSLRALQEWLMHAISHGESAEAGAREASLRLGLPALQNLLTPSATQSAAERLGVYHHAYRARLVECLLDDYPVLAQALGDAFDSVCHSYVAKNPSRSFSLNHYGQGMSEHLRASGPEPRQLFAELAALEWALVVAVHAPAAPALSLERVQAVPAEAWQHAVLVPAPSLSLHSFEYPVNAYYKLARGADTPGQLPSSPEPGALAVCRREMRIWRVELSPAGAVALRALCQGVALLPALSAAEARPEQVSVWFRTWMECGFFSDVSVSPGQACG